MTEDYEYQLLKKAQEHLVLAGKIENKDCDIFDHPQLSSIEELAKEWADEMLDFVSSEKNNLNKLKEKK